MLNSNLEPQLEPRMAAQAAKLGLGPTGDFPQGQLSPNDEGGLRVGLTDAGGKLVLHFGKSITWVALSPSEALQLANALLTRAEVLIREEHGEGQADRQ